MHFRAGAGSGQFGGKAPLARALSKLGFCSRREALELIHAGQVAVNSRVCRDAAQWVHLEKDRIEARGQQVQASAKAYLMLNKPRGLVTSTSDEQGRETVFACLRGEWRRDATSTAFGAGLDLPRVFPVGRLDKASEGLLLFTNDTAWAEKITSPANGVEKTYHAQINRVADTTLTRQMETGVESNGELLSAKRVSVLREGGKNSWLEIVLEEGRNRHIRRLLEALDVETLRLIRVRIGGLELGSLAKGDFRRLTRAEMQMLA